MEGGGLMVGVRSITRSPALSARLVSRLPSEQPTSAPSLCHWALASRVAPFGAATFGQTDNDHHTFPHPSAKFPSPRTSTKIPLEGKGV